MGYITEQERYQIEVLLREKYKPKEIAQILGRSLSGIYKEIKRGKITLLNSDLTERKEYCADVGQRMQDEAAAHKGISYKIGCDYELAEFLEKKIYIEKWSPSAVCAYIKNEQLQFQTTLCPKTIYNYIHNNLFMELSGKHLEKRKWKKQQNKKKKKVALKNLKARSISKRSDIINHREEYGHWEMDTVVGCQGGEHDCLLVLSERLTRNEKIIKLKSKTQKEVIKALNRIEKEMGAKAFRETFKTITMDNGVEFLDFKGIEKSRYTKKPRTKTYYCHPYCSWERGTNENINRMIRRFIPKGTDIAAITKKQIQWIENWINNYPRKIFGWKSSNQMLQLVS